MASRNLRKAKRLLKAGGGAAKLIEDLMPINGPKALAQEAVREARRNKVQPNE